MEHPSLGGSVELIAKSYLKRIDFNVIVLDWSKLSGVDYFTAVSNAAEVSQNA